MDGLELCKANSESLILSVAEKHLPQLSLVMTVSGIQPFAAIDIISEIGVDMSVFPTSKHLCSRAGLTPQNNESCRKEENHQNQQSRSLHQTFARPVCAQCNSFEKQSRSPHSLPQSQKAARSQERDYRYRSDVIDCHLQHPQEERAVQCRTLPQI